MDQPATKTTASMLLCWPIRCAPTGPGCGRWLEPQTTALRTLCRARRDLVAHRVAVQCTPTSTGFIPPVGLSMPLDSPISLTFLTRFDCQDRADWLEVPRLGAWLASVGYKATPAPPSSTGD